MYIEHFNDSVIISSKSLPIVLMLRLELKHSHVIKDYLTIIHKKEFNVQLS